MRAYRLFLLFFCVHGLEKLRKIANVKSQGIEQCNIFYPAPANLAAQVTALDKNCTAVKPSVGVCRDNLTACRISNHSSNFFCKRSAIYARHLGAYRKLMTMCRGVFDNDCNISKNEDVHATCERDTLNQRFNDILTEFRDATYEDELSMLESWIWVNHTLYHYYNKTWLDEKNKSKTYKLSHFVKDLTVNSSVTKHPEAVLHSLYIPPLPLLSHPSPPAFQLSPKEMFDHYEAELDRRHGTLMPMVYVPIREEEIDIEHEERRLKEVERQIAKKKKEKERAKAQRLREREERKKEKEERKKAVAARKAENAAKEAEKAEPKVTFG